MDTDGVVALGGRLVGSDIVKGTLQCASFGDRRRKVSTLGCRVPVNMLAPHNVFVQATVRHNILVCYDSRHDIDPTALATTFHGPRNLEVAS